jgi:apolipoprotein N-acyltransferase
MHRTAVLGVDLAVSGAVTGEGLGARSLRYTDSAEVLGANHGRFDSRQPVPPGVWRPGANVSAVLGNLAQPYLTVASRRVAFSICYEDFQWWPNWRLLIERSNVPVGMSNGWVNSDLAIDATQTQVVDQFTAEDGGSDKADSHTADFAL